MIDLSAQPNSSWTTRELRAWIRRATQDLNREFIGITESGVDLKKDDPLLYEQRNRLIELGTGKEFRGGIGMGLTYKNKIELVKQARALRETYNIMENPAAEEEEILPQFESFKDSHPGFDLSYEEYKEMTETLGAMGTHLLDEFGDSEDFVDAYEEARSQNKSDRDITTAVVEVNREKRGQGWNTEQMMEALRDKLGL